MSCGTTDLICLNSGVCGCKSSDYKWDHEQELCVALVDTNAECRKWGWDGTLAIPCTENAICTAEHRCQCLHYFVPVDHECIATYDGICSSSKDCNQKEFLYCGKEGKCECRPGTVRSQKGGVFGCFVKIGGKFLNGWLSIDKLIRIKTNRNLLRRHARLLHRSTFRMFQRRKMSLQQRIYSEQRKHGLWQTS